MRRPGRAKMCNWLAGELHELAGRTMPFNPADIKQMAYNARDVDVRLSALASIAFELGWHADSDLDEAWALIQQYETLPRRKVADDHAPKRRADVEIGSHDA